MNDKRNENASDRGDGRHDAINQAEKGRLFRDVSAKAAEFGYNFPISFSLAAWNTCVAIWGESPGQDEDLRMLAVLEAFDKACTENCCTELFDVTVPGPMGERHVVKLRVACRHFGTSNKMDLIIMLAEDPIIGFRGVRLNTPALKAYWFFPWAFRPLKTICSRLGLLLQLHRTTVR